MSTLYDNDCAFKIYFYAIVIDSFDAILLVIAFKKISRRDFWVVLIQRMKNEILTDRRNNDILRTVGWCEVPYLKNHLKKHSYLLLSKYKYILLWNRFCINGKTDSKTRLKGPILIITIFFIGVGYWCMSKIKIARTTFAKNLKLKLIETNTIGIRMRKEMNEYVIFIFINIKSIALNVDWV